MLAPEPVEGPSTVSSASVAEGQARQLFLDSLLLSRVLGARQPVGKLEESIAFGVLGLSPDSTNSAITRLVLARFARASVRTLRATPAERVTLCRNGLAELGTLLEYTTLHHSAPTAKRYNSGAEGYRFEPYRAYQ